MTSRTDTIRREPARAYRDTFAPSDPAEPDALPPGWHKLYFTAAPRLDELRPDGTPGRDGVVPDIALPRPVYAGEELTFHRPIRFGETLELTTTLGDVKEKTGGSGPLQQPARTAADLPKSRTHSQGCVRATLRFAGVRRAARQRWRRSTQPSAALCNEHLYAPPVRGGARPWLG